MRPVVAVLVALLGGILPGPGGTRAQQPAGATHIGDVFVQTIPAQHYVHGSIDTDFKSMREPVGKTLDALGAAAKDKKVQFKSPLLHLYHGGAHAAPGKPFKMETGFFVAEGVKEVGDFKVRQLPRFKCASLFYVGPGPRIGEAWQALYAALPGKGLTPTGEEREWYLYWEGPDSPNNIVQVQVGVK
jgi:effector-binding domain-containing protein